VREVFERGGQRAVLETRYLDADTYELRLTDAHGVDSVEYVTTLRAVVERQIAIHLQLARDRWTRMGMPKP
jgi:hypothetical protein